jgi:hypothetical protein
MDLSLLVLLAKSRLNPASEDLDMTQQQRAENEQTCILQDKSSLDFEREWFLMIAYYFRHICGPRKISNPY